MRYHKICKTTNCYEQADIEGYCKRCFEEFDAFREEVMKDELTNFTLNKLAKVSLTDYYTHFEELYQQCEGEWMER